MTEFSEISKTYSPEAAEAKWYQYWLDHKFFAAKPNSDKKPYTIVIPPPNVTGVLHMGHMLNNTIQDILIRRARMKGFEACWVPGTDHASIATEAKVVNMLKEKGISKKDISREEFMKYAWEWKEKYGGLILEQLKKLGASCDWDRTRFTMESKLSEAVIEVFVDLYRKGYIYRAVRMINWDPAGKTALSDEEVIFKENHSKLVFVKYEITDDSGSPTSDFITVATTRPETIMGDVAVCVHPDDERYKHLIGKKVRVPLINRLVPVLTDTGIDVAFGTGTLKVTPAHDLYDYEIGLKYNLEVIDTLNEDGTLNEKCGVAKYVGKDRFIVRKEVIKDLQELGLLVKTEDYKNQVGTSERTGAVIEPRLSMQWWLKMSEISKPALENVMNDTIQFHPEKFKNMYRSWMENVRDWCISRQLWWGQQIPAFYLPNGEIIVAKNKEEALKIANKGLTSIDGYILAAERGNISEDEIPHIYSESDLRQDEDVLDTWFSSWLWPISVFDGFENPENEDISYFYPTQTLVTAPDIIFFWVARMIIAGYEYRQELPFKDVYFTGLIRDQYGRKMSKSLGNSPDPIQLMERYGADGVRTGLLFSSPAGNDLIFDTPVPKTNKKEDVEAFLANPANDPLASKLCEQGRDFANKIWNAYRLLEIWGSGLGLGAGSREQGAEENQQFNNSTIQQFITHYSLYTPHHLSVSWFESRFNQVLAEMEEDFEKFRISDALMKVYKLIWNDFCDWYLEMVKPEYGQPIEEGIYKVSIAFYDKLMRLLHPFMPFITEDMWQRINNFPQRESICVAEYPIGEDFDVKLINDFDFIRNVISKIRNLKNTKGISPKLVVPLLIKTQTRDLYENYAVLIQKLANVGEIGFTTEKSEGTVGFIVGTDEFFVPLEEELDIEAELKKVQQQLQYEYGFQDSVLKKLSNEKFVQNAKPEIVETERKKLADAESRIQSLEERLEMLKKQ